MVVLIDTNVVLDNILERQPYQSQADKIFELCLNNRINGCVAAHTITNLFFILRKDKSIKERRVFLLDLCNILTVIGLDAVKLISALHNDAFDDFEDCLQDECADSFNADYLITRNIKDFIGSKVKAIEPKDFLLLVEV